MDGQSNLETGLSHAPRVAAFFDLDKTLLTANSGRLWMVRQYRDGRIGIPRVLQGAFYLMLYRVGAVDMEGATRTALQLVKGLPEDHVRGWTEEWFEQDVIHHAAPGAWSVIDEHRRQGHRLVLHTSSSPYASHAAVQFFGLDDYLSTLYETREGRFTGEFVEPLCYGKGKVTLARRYADAHGIDLAASFFYSDSITDLPMLEAVGNPRAVHPDGRLRRIARQRNWPILDWHEPPPT
jgi:HAD superfamily hydrolase (TIGR01490 family)